MLLAVNGFIAMVALGMAPDGQVPPVPPPPVILRPPAPPPMAPKRVGLEAPGHPVGNPGQWVTSDDYPVLAMRERREGTTDFRLTYDASGTPTRCDVTSSSGHEDLDGRTCDLAMERARFRPGTNAAGEAVGGTYSNRVRWTMPGPFPNRFADGAISVEFILGADGEPRGCKVETFGDPGGLPFRGEDACTSVPRFEPFRNADGTAVERRVRLDMSVSVTDTGPAAPRKPSP